MGDLSAIRQQVTGTEFISILTHKKIENMNKSFKVYNHPATLNTMLEFTVTFVCT